MRLRTLLIIWSVAFLLGMAARMCRAQPPLHVRQGWYDRLTPRPGGPSCLVGPWFSLGAARDWLGSAQRAHPWACHITGPHPPSNCRDLGNGYGYLPAIPFPPPYAVPVGDALLLPIQGNPNLHGKFVRLFYGADGSCTVVVKGQATPPIAGAFTCYSDSKCPDWPWLKGADGPYDGVCN